MISQISCNFNWQCEAKSRSIRDTYTQQMREEGTEFACFRAKYVLNWNFYFWGSKDRMCQLFQFYSRPDLNWLSNIIYSLWSCPPYISIHVFSKMGEKTPDLRFIRKGHNQDLREIKTSSKLQTNQQCCYIT